MPISDHILSIRDALVPHAEALGSPATALENIRALASSRDNDALGAHRRCRCAQPARNRAREPASGGRPDADGSAAGLAAPLIAPYIPCRPCKPSTPASSSPSPVAGSRRSAFVRRLYVAAFLPVPRAARHESRPRHRPPHPCRHRPQSRQPPPRWLPLRARALHALAALGLLGRRCLARHRGVYPGLLFGPACSTRRRPSTAAARTASSWTR